MNERNILIVRAGEVALKGMNKPYFERMLLSRIKNVLRGYSDVEAYRKEGLIFVKTSHIIVIFLLIICELYKFSGF